ncbi:MAG TPA: class I SAM-dependent methyltransferase [Acidimicrobiales bacterium]|nr:class I SAM-dependent methyltransferase [Acidimicrobiales bacterium]
MTVLAAGVASGVVVAVRVCTRSGHERGRPFFGRCYGQFSRRADAGELGVRRRMLLADARGRVLDLGAGPGDVFRHLPTAVSGLVAIEPDRTMLKQARRRLGEAPAPVPLVRGVGERLPFSDAAFDTVVAALVLCTVDDPHAVVAEIHRVLRPGGRLLLMEHVRASDETLARWQDRLQPLWSRCNGGCRPNRTTLETVREAGFRFQALEEYGYPVLPHIRGQAVR